MASVFCNYIVIIFFKLFVVFFQNEKKANFYLIIEHILNC